MGMRVKGGRERERGRERETRGSTRALAYTLCRTNSKQRIEEGYGIDGAICEGDMSGVQGSGLRVEG